MDALAVRRKIFGGHKAGLTRIVRAAGVPSHNARHIGELAKNTTTDDMYIATDTSGTWVKVNA